MPVFQWEGDKADAPGKEGTILLNDDDWDVFSSARSGYTGIRSGYYDDWFKGIQDELQRMKKCKNWRSRCKNDRMGKTGSGNYIYRI